ncbi:hypothetical protein SLS62_000456 [Diatrype stigma]|uniref:AB hydrolase-1 domain-containing protein n=1 Tax=Diatrype stigma TaxID=117547 RepID=A0AAN9V1F2_9PEZI
MLDFIHRKGPAVLWTAALVAAAVASYGATPHLRETFFVGGEYADDGEGGHVIQGQMYVEHLTPATGHEAQPYPIIFIHGATRTGIDWLTKPDGQPGWADHFLARGYECYLVDLPYQGRSVVAPTEQPLRHFSAEVAAQRFTAPEKFDLWPQAALHTRWPGPTGQMGGDPFFDQLLASGNYLIDNATFQQTAARAAMAALLDRVAAQPVVLLGHSNGGATLWATADARPGRVAAVVGLEPLGPPFRNEAPGTVEDARAWGLTDIPVAYEPPVAHPAVDLVKVAHAPSPNDTTAPPPDDGMRANCTLQAEPGARRWANLAGLPVLVVTGQASYHARYDWCSVAFLRQVGVEARHLLLESVGITGNGHFMFMETNSEDIAEQVVGWLASGFGGKSLGN